MWAVLLAGGVLSASADTVLVLPFVNASQSPNLDWIGESIAETTREVLSEEGVLAVRRNDRVEAFRRLAIRPDTQLTRASVIKLGEAVDADQIIYGNFTFQPETGPAPKSRGSVRIVTHLLDLKGLRRASEYSETGALEDLAALQSHLAWQTLKLVAPKTAPSEDEFRRRRPIVRVDAMENYVRGLLAPAFDQKVRFFLQSARIDPRFTEPCFQLGRLHYERKNYRVAADWLTRVSPQDAHYHEANFYLGLCRYFLADYSGAQQAFQVVSRTVPLNEVYNNLGAAQARASEPQALENLKRALEGDATDPAYHFNVGYTLWKQGRYDEAAARFRAVLDRNPNDAQAATLLARSQQQSGPRPQERGFEGLERLKENYDESAYWQLKAMLEPKR